MTSWNNYYEALFCAATTERWRLRSQVIANCILSCKLLNVSSAFICFKLGTHPYIQRLTSQTNSNSGRQELFVSHIDDQLVAVSDLEFDFLFSFEEWWIWLRVFVWYFTVYRVVRCNLKNVKWCTFVQEIAYKVTYRMLNRTVRVIGNVEFYRLERTCFLMQASCSSSAAFSLLISASFSENASPASSSICLSSAASSLAWFKWACNSKTACEVADSSCLFSFSCLISWRNSAICAFSPPMSCCCSWKTKHRFLDYKLKLWKEITT